MGVQTIIYSALRSIGGMCGLIHNARRGAMTSNSIPKGLCRMYGNLIDSQDREPRHLSYLTTATWEPQTPDCGQ